MLFRSDNLLIYSISVGPIFCPLAVAVIGVLRGMGVVAAGVEGAGG